MVMKTNDKNDGRISFSGMAKIAEQHSDRYRTVACFADDVLDVRRLAGMGLKSKSLYRELVRLKCVGVGRYVFQREEGGKSYIVQMRQSGIIEVHQTNNANDDCPDPCELAMDAVEKAIEAKEGLVDEVFVLLKDQVDQSEDVPKQCLLYQYKNGDMEMFPGVVFNRWVKKHLWPQEEVS